MYGNFIYGTAPLGSFILPAIPTWEYLITMYGIDPFIFRDVQAGNTYWFKGISLSPQGVEGVSPQIASVTMVGTSAVGITSLQADAAFKNVFLNWVSVLDTFVNKTEIWRSNSNDRAAASLIASVYGTDYTDLVSEYGVTRYYWVRNKNPNGGYSAWYPVGQYAGVSATTALVVAADIGLFAITASRIFTKIPIVTGDAWTDNSPDAGKVAWNEHTLYYNGVAYTIAAGNTALKYIYWLNTGVAYTASNTNPILTDGDFVIAVNIAGAHDLAWNAVANQLIGSAYIQDAAIINAKIGNLEVDSAKIANLTVGTGKITGLAVTRGAHYYNAAVVDLGWDVTEEEVGTITIYLNESTDFVFLWCSVQITESILVTGKETAFAKSIDFRLRRDSITGTIIAAGETVGYWETSPIILIGTDIPGVAGNRTYKLTAANSTIENMARTGKVAFRKIIGMAKSR